MSSNEESYDELDSDEISETEGSYEEYNINELTQNQIHLGFSDYSIYFENNYYWTDRKQMLDWARKIAFSHNFVLTLIRSYSSSTTRYGSVLFGCENYRENKSRKKKIVGSEVPVIIPRDGRSKKDNCPFVLYGWEAERNVWRLNVECGVHNHNLPPSLEGHQMVSRLKDEEFQLVRDLTLAGVKPSPLLAALKNICEDNLTSRQQIYNAREKIKKDEMLEMTPMQHLLNMLAHRKLTFNYRLLTDGSLQDLAFPFI